MSATTMTTTGYGSQLLRALVRHGFTHATGVPCSYLAEPFAELEGGGSGLVYVPSNREDNALGLASGLAVAGARPVVLMQNSGLGYSFNVLTSFNLVYDVPLSLVVSWRGYADDAIEHDVIGRTLPGLLSLHDIATIVFDPETDEDATRLIEEFAAAEGRTVALLVRRGMGR